MTRIVVVGGGPGGYEAALVARRLGAEVTVVDCDGIGGSCVLTDCVPSKTLVATSEAALAVASSAELGVQACGAGSAMVDLARVNARVLALAAAQSADIRHRLLGAGVRILYGRASLAGPEAVVAHPVGDEEGSPPEELPADAVLVATGARPRVLPEARPDGERILTWTQVYDLTEVPEHLIVVGSGVTGAEFASAYQNLGAQVTLVSSREHVLPGEDADAAVVLEEAFRRRGMRVANKSRAAGVVRTDAGVRVTLTDGRTLDGSHCLMAVGSVPNTSGIGLEGSGVALGAGGFVEVDRVSRTSARGVYAAGDCTGVLMLASVAAQQGRIAMQHALGDYVRPLDLRSVAANVFTSPEIATVGVTQEAVERGDMSVRSVTLPLATNARAKMHGVRDGFVKLFCRPGTGIVVGGVVVAPRASELIFPISLAVDQRLSVDQIAQAFTVYPSMTGSVAEAARMLHLPG